MIIRRKIDTVSYCTGCHNFIGSDASIKFPLVLNWLITSSCDLKCRYCFATDIRNTDYITKELYEYVNKSQFLKLVISGGEPLQNNKVWDILEKIDQKNKAVVIDTNGVFKFGKEHIRIIKDKNVTIRISIDSANPKENEKIRPSSEEYFEKVINNIELLQNKNNICVELQTVVTKLNIKSLVNLSALVEHWKIKKWYLQPMVPSGRGALIRDIAPTFKSIKKECQRLPIDERKFVIKEDENHRAVVLLNNYGDIITEERNEKVVIGNIKTMKGNHLLGAIDIRNHIRRYKILSQCNCAKEVRELNIS